MAWIFSKRCQQALKDKKIEVSIPRAARIRILRLLEQFNEYDDVISDSGFVGSTSYLDELPKKIKAELGLPDLIAFPESGDGPAKPSNLQGFILRGNYPPYLFDAIELFYDLLAPDKGSNFQKDFNQILEESNLSWRMADGKIFPVDSTYIEEQITRTAYELLHEIKFQGALQEFEKARIDFVNGDYSGAIQNANLAVEGAIKGILHVQKAKPGELFRKIIDSGYLPNYYSGFLKAFEENILRSVAIMRNEELGAGHSQGAGVNIIPKSLAELAVNLSGVLINYLIKRYLEINAQEDGAKKDLEKEMPF